MTLERDLNDENVGKTSPERIESAKGLRRQALDTPGVREATGGWSKVSKGESHG